MRPQAAALFAAACAADIPAEYKEQVTMYHLNPRSAGALPVDMDSGDAEGDLNFYLGEFLLPLECANKTAGTMAGFDCSNPERVDPDLVVTKVVMDVDSRMTAYSACNLCNGTDPFGHNCPNPDPVTHKCPCKVGTYVCDCFSHHHSGGSTTCDPTKVGVESRNRSYVAAPAAGATCADALQQTCGKYRSSSSYCNYCVKQHRSTLEQAGCNSTAEAAFCGGSPTPPTPGYGPRCGQPGAPAWECWSSNVQRKVGGNWYSTLAEGQCNSTGLPCGWKALTLQTVREPCLKDKLMTAVEQKGGDCFTGCGPRNATSPCWIGCFMDTLLGEGARSSSREPLGGIDKAIVIKAWDDSFLPEADGGCPTVTDFH